MQNYFLFMDESGDHGLDHIDNDYPIFTLCGIIFKHEDYVETKEKIIAIKNKYWNPGQTVILHSRDIRKWQKEFQILMNPEIRQPFLEDISNLIEQEKFVVIASCVDKKEYIKRYGKLTRNIYTIAISNIIERAVFWLDEQPETNKRLLCIIESRGKREDAELNNAFSLLRDRGTNYVNSVRIKEYGFTLNFRKKAQDIEGLQIADLIAYPITTQLIDPSRANPAYEIIKEKYYQRKGKVFGLKISP